MTNLHQLQVCNFRLHQ